MTKETRYLLGIIAVIRPESNFKFYWELFITPILVILVFIVPIDAAFIDDESSFSVNLVYFCTAVFSIEIIITFNSGIYIEGRACLDRIVIIKQYLRFWFWIDILSTIPFDLLIGSMQRNDSFKKKVVIGDNFKILRIFKLIKIVRVTKLNNLFYSFEDKITKKKNIVLIKLTKVCIYVFMVANNIACSPAYSQPSHL